LLSLQHRKVLTFQKFWIETKSFPTNEADNFKPSQSIRIQLSEVR